MMWLARCSTQPMREHCWPSPLPQPLSEPVRLFSGCEPEELPKDGNYANLVMWAGFAALLYSAWKESGSVMPSTDLKKVLLPSGPFGKAITLIIVWYLLWGLPMCLLRQPMLDGFARGFMDALLTMRHQGQSLHYWNMWMQAQRTLCDAWVDVLTTWQGTVVYAAVISLSLLMINRQQQDLAMRNSQSLQPVRVDLQGLRQAEAIPSSEPQIRALRPLEQALQRQPQDWLKAAGGVPIAQPGILSLTLTQARQLRVSILQPLFVAVRGGTASSECTV